jgi:NitT/TauT family transport system ATP-binding protein
MTVFMVSHDLSEAFKLGDRVLVFDKVRHDPDAPEAYGATITYDLDARNGGIPFQDAAPRGAPAGAPAHPPPPPPERRAGPVAANTDHEGGST